MKLGFHSSKVALVGAGILALAILGKGCQMRVSEQNRPVNYSPEKCFEKINSANSLEMREIPFSWGNTYNVLVDGERVGTVKEEVFSWGNKFNFYAGTLEQGKYLGHAKEEVFSIGHKSTVYDDVNKEIGRLDEVVLSLNPGVLIDVFDSSGKKVAISDERAFSVSYSADLFDSTGKKSIGETSKDMFWDNYLISVPKSLDKRLVMALVSLEDKLRKSRSRESRRSR